MELLRQKERPYVIETDLSKVVATCELCASLPCCPDHCCNWDDCDCGDCPECGGEKPAEGKALRRVMNEETCEDEFHETNEAEFFAKQTGEEVASILNRPVSRVLLTKAEIKEDIAKAQVEQTLDSIPQEVTKTADGDILVHNFEVEIKEEKQVAYASGVRGIRALRLQRDILQDTEVFDQEIMSATRNRFFAYEQREELRKEKAAKKAKGINSDSEEESESDDELDRKRFVVEESKGK